MQSISMVVRPLIAYEITGGDPLALGAVSFSVAIPMIVLAPFGGVLADRVDRRKLIALCQTAALIGELTTATLFALGELRMPHLIGLAVLIGCLFALMMPCRQAIVVNIIGKARLGNAMAVNMAGMNATRIIGPAAAGFSMEAFGIPTTYLAGVTLYAVALVALLGVGPAPPPPDAGHRPVLASIMDGVRYLRDSKMVMLLLLFGLLPMLLMMPFQTLLAIFAKDVWQVGERGFGLLNMFAGIGGVLGTVIVAVRGEADRRFAWMATSVLAFGVFLGLFSISPFFGLGLALLLVANIFAQIFGVLNNTAVQQLIPDAVRGRISSFLMMSFSLPMLGTLPIAAVAQRYGAPLAVGAASIIAIALSIGFVLLSPSLRHLDLAVRRAVDHGT
jgi:MFS family permease